MADAPLESFQISRQRARHASRRNRSISGPRFRWKPSLKRATGAAENKPPNSDRPPHIRVPDEIPKPRFADFPANVPGNRRFPRRPEIGRCVGGATPRRGPRQSAQLVDLSTPFSPLTLSKTPDGEARKHAAEFQYAPPYVIPTRSQNPDFRIPPTMSPEIADFRVGPKSGDVWAGRLSNAGPRRSGQPVDFRAPFSPETPRKTRVGDVRTRAAGNPPI